MPNITFHGGFAYDADTKNLFIYTLHAQISTVTSKWIGITLNEGVNISSSEESDESLDFFCQRLRQEVQNVFKTARSHLGESLPSELQITHLSDMNLGFSVSANARRFDVLSEDGEYEKLFCEVFSEYPLKKLKLIGISGDYNENSEEGRAFCAVANSAYESLKKKCELTLREKGSEVPLIKKIFPRRNSNSLTSVKLLPEVINLKESDIQSPSCISLSVSKEPLNELIELSSSVGGAYINVDHELMKKNTPKPSPKESPKRGGGIIESVVGHATAIILSLLNISPDNRKIHAECEKETQESPEYSEFLDDLNKINSMDNETVRTSKTRSTKEIAEDEETNISQNVALS